MLDKKTIEILRKDFPKESVQIKYSFKNPDTGKPTELTGYKPQYYIEKLNDAFGHDGWDFEIREYGLSEDGKWAWVWGRLSIFHTEINKDSINGPVIRQLLSFKDQFGTSKHNASTGVGDAYKGAATNSMEKAASFYDIGHKAYKGLEPAPGKRQENLSDREKITKELAVVCKEYNIKKAAFAVVIETVLKSKKAVSELTEEELTKTLEYIKKNKAPF